MFGLNKKEEETPVKKEGISVLFDIGGTKMRVAVSTDDYTFEEPHISKTPDSFVDGMRVFDELVKGAVGGRKIKAAAGGIAGTLLPDRSAVFRLPNLPKWSEKPLSANLFHLFKGVPVIIENDAAVVGLGEAVSGAGQGKSIVMYMTVSTGVGGARIIDGYVDRSAVGFEPGHQIISYKEQATLEALVSGKAIEKRFGIKPYDLESLEKRQQIADELSVGLANSILHWSPDILVLGGSLIVGARNTLPVDRIEANLKRLLEALPEVPRIKKAVLGDLGGLHGAMALIRQS